MFNWPNDLNEAADRELLIAFVIHSIFFFFYYSWQKIKIIDHFDIQQRQSRCTIKAKHISVMVLKRQTQGSTIQFLHALQYI